MTEWYEQVQDFSKLANKAQNELDPIKWPLIPESPTNLSDGAIKFITQMVLDEIEEFEEATTDYEQADALLDIIYYTLDTAAKHSLEIEIPSTRKHPDAKPALIEDGKVDMISRSLKDIIMSLSSTDHQHTLNTLCVMAERFADAHGFHLEPLFQLVQDANMDKFPEGIVTLDTNPKSKRYGKVEKPEGWTAPDSKIKAALEAQSLTINYEGGDIDEWLKEQRKKAGHDEL